MSDPGVLPIVECGDPVLRRPAEPADPADLRTSELRRLIAQLRATMEATIGNYAQRWARRSPEEAAASLGFTL